MIWTIVLLAGVALFAGSAIEVTRAPRAPRGGWPRTADEMRRFRRSTTVRAAAGIAAAHLGAFLISIAGAVKLATWWQ